MEIYRHNAVHNRPAPMPTPKKNVLRIACICLLCVCMLLCVATFVLLLSGCNAQNGGANDTQGDYASAYKIAAQSSVEVYGAGTAGSGVVYKIADGKTYVITNKHVVGNTDTAQVRFSEYGDKIPGKVLGYDTYHDIALLEADGEYNMAAAQIGATPHVGTRVLAVGNALGYGIAAFDGIVSRTNRMFTIDGKTVPVHAVTSPINAGMSGGGLFTLDGKLVGINTYQTGSVNENGTSRPVDGVSYSVPVSIVQKLAARIYDEQSGEQVNTLYVVASSSTEDEIDFNDLSFTAWFKPQGLVINAVLIAQDPPAGLSGGVPQEGDVVTKLGDVNVNEKTEFAELFTECLRYVKDPSTDGQPLKIELQRGNETIVLTYNYKRQKY